MKHQVILESASFVKTIKDSSLYLAKDDPGNPASCVLLELSRKQKIMSVIACDGRGYYESSLKLVQARGVRQSLPGKPMRLLIARDSVSVIAKHVKCAGNLVIEVDDSQTQKTSAYAVEIVFPNEASVCLTSPANLKIPDYASLRKKAEKGKQARVSLGQVMLPVKELARAGKVFPAPIGETIPMYISQWQKNGLLTLLEYESESENMRVIFALGLPEAA